MTKTNKKCTDCGACNHSHVDAKNATFANASEAYTTSKVEDVNYSYYSRILKEPFESLEELSKAEEAYYAEQKAKEDKVAQKKADAQKVEDAFKALNAARKTYKEELAQLTKEYAEALENLKKVFDLGKKDISDHLATAEEAYSKALKEFTDKYDQYHFCLKGDDFETTISGSSHVSENKKETSKTNNIFDIFDYLFRF